MKKLLLIAAFASPVLMVLSIAGSCSPHGSIRVSGQLQSEVVNATIIKGGNILIVKNNDHSDWHSMILIINGAPPNGGYQHAFGFLRAQESRWIGLFEFVSKDGKAFNSEEKIKEAWIGGLNYEYIKVEIRQ